MRKADRESRLEEFTEFMDRNREGFTRYDDEVVRWMVERITVIDAETIRVKIWNSDMEIEQTIC